MKVMVVEVVEKDLRGTQRGSIEARLWLAMAGHIPWAWLPTMPAELWLLPTVTWLSPSHVSPWARGDPPHLLSVPEIGLACEVLLADRLFHDLSPAERDGLARWIRANQQPSGACLDHGGKPDLSRTALGWWALVESGDDPDAEHLVRSRRVVHELGGAQRASAEVRLWLAMAGHIPWAWLPPLPAELWLLPTVAWLSPSRVSPWARGAMTPYLLLTRAPARVHVSNAAALLLTRRDAEPILPRLVQPGLLGDLLQAFDQGVKLVRKLPRGPVLTAALARVQRGGLSSCDKQVSS